MGDAGVFRRIEDGVKEITGGKIMAHIDVVEDGREFRMCMPDTLSGEDIKRLRDLPNVADVLITCRDDYLCLRICVKVDEEHRKLAAARRTERVALVANMQLEKRGNPAELTAIVGSMVQHLPCEEPKIDSSILGLYRISAVIKPGAIVSWDEIRAFANSHVHRFTIGLDSDDVIWWLRVTVDVAGPTPAKMQRKRGAERMSRRFDPL